MNIVYTAIFGQYDKPRSPTAVSPTTSYFCLTDNTSWTTAEPYKFIPHPKHGDDRRTARFYKINSHLVFPMADITVWHGGNVQLECTPEQLIDTLGDADIATLVHNQRDCLYDEAEMCQTWKLDDRDLLQAQVDRYRQEGMPEHYGLYATFLLVRRTSPTVMQFNKAWWQEVEQNSVRDQVSFPYICWKMGIEPKIIPGDIYSGECYKRHALHEGVHD